MEYRVSAKGIQCQNKSFYPAENDDVIIPFIVGFFILMNTNNTNTLREVSVLEKPATTCI